MGRRMKSKTYLTNCLKNFGNAAQYDAEAKKIMADKGLMAMILKEAVKELRGYERSEIERFIEGVRVSRAHAAAITGMNAEDAEPEEGTVRYDVKFFVIIPGRERIKIIINLEVQKEYLRKQLMPRGIYYCCRSVTGQKDREFEGADYAGIKKTYGIWLNLNAPRREADSTFCVELRPRVLTGSVNPEKHRYDLMNVTMIGLDDESYARRATKLHGYLGTIFTTKLSPQEKIRILQEEYGVEPTKEVREGVGNMCNLGEVLVMETWEKAVKETRRKINKETRKKIMKANQRAEVAETRAEEARVREEAAETRAEAEKARADQAERELEKLRKLLDQTN